MADFSRLDRASVQAFIDGDLSTFVEDLKQILEGDPSMRDMADGVTTEDTVGAVSAGKPIMMGLIDADDLTSGAGFADALASNIDTVVSVLMGQQETFEEIDEGLRTTFVELFNTQGDNLGSIEADTFTDVLSDSGFTGEAAGGGQGGSSGGNGRGGDGGDGDDDE